MHAHEESLAELEAVKGSKYLCLLLPVLPKVGDWRSDVQRVYNV
jgi:hypothetical protein